MVSESEQDAVAGPIRDSGIQKEFTKSGYAEQQDLDGASHVPVAAPIASRTSTQLGASPIRWIWWAGAAAVSIGLWWVIVDVAGVL